MNDKYYCLWQQSCLQVKYFLFYVYSHEIEIKTVFCFSWFHYSGPLFQILPMFHDFAYNDKLNESGMLWL